MLLERTWTMHYTLKDFFFFFFRFGFCPFVLLLYFWYNEKEMKTPVCMAPLVVVSAQTLAQNDMTTAHISDILAEFSDSAETSCPSSLMWKDRSELAVNSKVTLHFNIVYSHFRASVGPTGPLACKHVLNNNANMLTLTIHNQGC